jgi:hypothetical protein
VRLSGEINDRVYIMIQRRVYRRAIGDVAANKSMAVFVESRQVVEITGVSERVEVGYKTIFGFIQNQPDESRSNKTSTACHENFSHVSLQKRNRIEQ